MWDLANYQGRFGAERRLGKPTERSLTVSHICASRRGVGCLCATFPRLFSGRRLLESQTPSVSSDVWRSHSEAAEMLLPSSTNLASFLNVFCSSSNVENETVVVKACTHTHTQICPCRASLDPFSFREEPSAARGRQQIKCLCRSSHLPAGKTIWWFSRSGLKLR